MKLGVATKRLTQAPGIFLAFFSRWLKKQISPALAMGRCHTQDVNGKGKKMQKYPREVKGWRNIHTHSRTTEHGIQSRIVPQHTAPLRILSLTGGGMVLLRWLISLRPWDGGKRRSVPPTVHQTGALIGNTWALKRSRCFT